jgi:hypothetical protein
MASVARIARPLANLARPVSRHTALSQPGATGARRGFANSAARMTISSPAQPFATLPPIYQELLQAKKRKGQLNHHDLLYTLTGLMMSLMTLQA